MLRYCFLTFLGGNSLKGVQEPVEQYPKNIYCGDHSRVKAGQFFTKLEPEFCNFLVNNIGDRAVCALYFTKTEVNSS